ncbi:hypothetical protein NMY3_00527 [Candidatus Nitrosocosmicus oleophilus]|uniref:Uncharacterized protein n=1 Tax=Candidatus Nitrosocosmicus oleophilus TaxID=1353260 RepID=A0A654LWL1_9ARCH|nr:hypothetical protein NMY3_00527 [Candidatus Nitrosocosmicus oleophilus]
MSKSNHLGHMVKKVFSRDKILCSTFMKKEFCKLICGIPSYLVKLLNEHG